MPASSRFLTATLAVITLSLPIAAIASCGGEGEVPTFSVVLTPADMASSGLWDVVGTVHFSSPVERGTPAHLQLLSTRPTALGDADATVSGNAPLATGQLSYRIKSLDSGNYFLFLWLDVNRDGSLGGGDLAGYYDGSDRVPNLQPATATPLGVRRSLSGVDFGVGPVP